MSPTARVVVTAPSRLHFGLLSFGDSRGRQFGGAGVMIDTPGVQVAINPAESLEIVGDIDGRVHQAARRWARSSGLSEPLRCRLELSREPRLHQGLGTGTQLSLAVGAGLDAFHRRPRDSVTSLACRMRRGLRSAVGTYGFSLGGLIAELGKLSHEPIAPLHEHVRLPAAWRFVLITPRGANQGLSGSVEQRAFDLLPPVPPDVTARLREELRQRMLPAARSARLLEFGDSVYTFGKLAGGCFKAVQHGSYNGPQLRELVQQLRMLGIRGVGQSSWGPTVFALCDNQATADDLAAELVRRGLAIREEIQCAAPSQHGASIERLNDLCRSP